MENNVLNAYIDRIYGYSIRHTFTREEADELSQEIFCTALKQLPTLRSEARFEPWLWGLAANVTRVYRRMQGKQRALYSYDALADTAQYDDYDGLDQALYDQVRAKIAGLSKTYRDIIVLHYYDNLSCKEISEKLGIPEGTVTWRLSEGRHKLKKEYDDMTETVLRPIAMSIGINGNGNYNGKDRPFPDVYIKDALSQNILYHCYKDPRTVEDFSKLCGVPAFYIEDAVANLLSREALTEPAKSKYRTDFIIYDETHTAYNEKAPALAADILDEYVTLLKTFASKVIGTGVYTAGRSENELVYLYGLLALEQLIKTYNPFPPVPYKVRYDGNAWAYAAHMAGTYKTGGMKAEKSLNLGTEGIYAHYAFTFAGFTYRPMMYDTLINVCEKLLNGAVLNEKEKELASKLIIDGYLSNANGMIKVCIPSFTLGQKQTFDQLAEDHFRDIMPKYAAALKKYADGYRKLFPKHLQDDVGRAIHYMFIGFFTNIALAAQERGLLVRPGENRFCDVLVQFKEK